MTVEILKQFYAHVRANPELEAQASRALEEGPEALVLLARLEGFAFTEQELSAALSEQGWLDEGELSDTDLDLVAGGIPPIYVNKEKLKKGL